MPRVFECITGISRMASEAEVGKIFEQDFQDRERNSGSAILQRVGFLDGRYPPCPVLTGDPANWGSKEESKRC